MNYSVLLCILLVFIITIQSQYIYNPINNSSFIIHGNYNNSYLLPLYDDIISRYINYFGEWEQPAIDVVVALLKLSKSRIFFDVGANVGAWTLPIAKYLRNSNNVDNNNNVQVYSFEAVFDNYLYLCSNIAINGLSNVNTYNYALSSVNDDIIKVPILSLLDNTLNAGGISLQYYENVINNNSNMKYKTVKTVTLDSIYNNNHVCPDFIKMDVENYEIKVLKGSITILQQCQPILFLEMECYATLKSIVYLLDYYGYSLAWTILPQFYLDDRKFSNYSWKDMNVDLSREIIKRSAKTITAVPNSKANEYFNNIIFNRIMFKIPPRPHNTSSSSSNNNSSSSSSNNSSSSGTDWLYSLNDQNIKMCVEGYCFEYKYDDNNDTHCNGVEIEETDRLHWKHIDSLLTQ